jgi:hypothetical protein
MGAAYSSHGCEPVVDRRGEPSPRQGGGISRGRRQPDDAAKSEKGHFPAGPAKSEWRRARALARHAPQRGPKMRGGGTPEIPGPSQSHAWRCARPWARSPEQATGTQTHTSPASARASGMTAQERRAMQARSARMPRNLAYSEHERELRRPVPKVDVEGRVSSSQFQAPLSSAAFCSAPVPYHPFGLLSRYSSTGPQ